MTTSKERHKWNDLNAEGVVAEMQRNGEAEHWDICRNLVRWVIDTHFAKLSPYREEVTQDILWLIYKNLATFEKRGSLTSWMLRIARNRAIDVLRKWENGQDLEVYLDTLPDAHAGQPCGLLAPTPRTPEELALIAEQHREVRELLREFLQLHKNSKRNGLILQLVLYAGYSQEEAALKLGVSAPLVGSVVRAAREYVSQKRQERGM